MIVYFKWPASKLIQNAHTSTAMSTSQKALFLRSSSMAWRAREECPGSLTMRGMASWLPSCCSLTLLPIVLVVLLVVLVVVLVVSVVVVLVELVVSDLLNRANGVEELRSSISLVGHRVRAILRRRAKIFGVTQNAGMVYLFYSSGSTARQPYAELSETCKNCWYKPMSFQGYKNLCPKHMFLHIHVKCKWINIPNSCTLIWNFWMHLKF